MKHITLEQRYEIQSLLKAGYTQKAIAKAIDKSESTISREIKRNKDLRGCGYKATTAQNKYRKRLLEKQSTPVLLMLLSKILNSC
jgi:IS30 family transposase